MGDVLTALSVQEFLKHAIGLRRKWMGKEVGLQPWFRGQESAVWPLIPKFYRSQPTDRQTEDEIREEFITRAPTLSDAHPANRWDWYFVMQHHGAPTRLLDWTEGALLGLYFAVRESKGRHDAAVWVLDPWWLNERAIGVDEVILPGDPGTLARDRTRMNKWLPPRFAKKRQLPRRPAAVYPGHILRRIGVQRSCFTIHGSDANGLHRLCGRPDSRVVKVVIPSYRIRTIRKTLATSGVDETTIFPDLEGLSRALISKWKDEVNTQPHDAVYTRLKPSAAHGVGVFAIRVIPKDTKLFSGASDEMVWIRKDRIASLPRSVRELYEDFGVLRNGRYGCPPSFDQLTMAWYLNQSSAPNVTCDANYDFYTRRKIEPGEELTVDYTTYSDDDAVKHKVMTASNR